MPSTSAALLFAFGLGQWLEDDPSLLPPSALAPVLASEDIEAGTFPPEVERARRAVAGLDKRPETPPTFDDFASAIEDLPETVTPRRRVWVRHRLRPRERLSQIAARYATTVDDIVNDNRLDPNLDPDRLASRKYRTLRVLARRIPPPRREVITKAAAGETWGDIALRMRVEELDLRSWNWQRRKLDAGRELTVWVDPMAKGFLHPGQGPEPPTTFEVKAGARSRGRPQQGRLDGGLMLPKSELYSRRPGNGGLYGSSHTIEQIQRAFAAFRHDSGYDGEVMIGAISRKHGGPYSPHISHQSGRDIDIRLPLLPGLPTVDHPNPDEVDWYATWALIRSFIDTGEVSVIFLDVSLHRRLYEAARILGETPESLEELITWPSWKGKNPTVKHSAGHDTHIHVRIACGPDEPRCLESNGRKPRRARMARARVAQP